MMPVYFDSTAFLAVIDELRQERGLSWSIVSLESGVDISSMTRALQPGRAGLCTHAVGALACWAGIADIRPYMRSYPGEQARGELPPGYSLQPHGKYVLVSYRGATLVSEKGKIKKFYSQARAIAYCHEHAKLRGAL